MTKQGGSLGGVKSVGRAMEVLSCFSTDHLEWGVSEIADYLGWYKSAAHRFLRSLEQGGYVERAPGQRYRLGVRVLELGNIYSFQSRILQVCGAPLRAVADKCGFSAHLAQLNGREALELFKAPGAERSSTIRVLRKPAHATALGKVLLATGPETLVERYIGPRQTLAPLTATTICRVQHFREHLKVVAERGFGLDNGEANPERFCLAVPVRDPLGQVVAAVSISTSRMQFTESNCMSYLPGLVVAAQQIEAGLR